MKIEEVGRYNRNKKLWNMEEWYFAKSFFIVVLWILSRSSLMFRLFVSVVGGVVVIIKLFMLLWTSTTTYCDWVSYILLFPFSVTLHSTFFCLFYNSFLTVFHIRFRVKGQIFHIVPFHSHFFSRAIPSFCQNFVVF